MKRVSSRKEPVPPERTAKVNTCALAHVEAAHSSRLNKMHDGIMELSGKRVLVTGGAGFVGSEVIRQLIELKADVTILDDFSSGRTKYTDGLPIKVVKGSITDNEVVESAGKNKDVIFHLAALPFIPDAYADPRPFFKVNLEGTVMLAWHAIHSKSLKSFVHISSSEVYGSALRAPMDEDHPTIPHSTYASSKLAGDRAIATMQKEHNLPAVVIRPFNCYGPRITQPYIIPEIMTSLLNSRTVNLGNVDASRDFTYVADTARGIILAATSESVIGETINLGSNMSITIRDLVFEIAKIMGLKHVTIRQDPTRFRPWDVERLICDYTKAKKKLGWRPEVPLKEGLTRTVEWLKTNPIRLREPFRGWPKAYKTKSHRKN